MQTLKSLILKIGRSSRWLPLHTANIISIYQNVPFVPLQLLAMVEMSSPVSRTITERLRLYSSQGEKQEPRPNVEMEQSVSKSAEDVQQSDCQSCHSSVRQRRARSLMSTWLFPSPFASLTHVCFGRRCLPSVAFLLKINLNVHYIIRVVKRFLKPILLFFLEYLITLKIKKGIF